MFGKKSTKKDKIVENKEAKNWIFFFKWKNYKKTNDKKITLDWLV